MTFFGCPIPLSSPSSLSQLLPLNLEPDLTSTLERSFPFQTSRNDQGFQF